MDDFGLASLTDREKQDLLEAIEERHGTGATIVTAQLPVADWHEYLGGGRIARRHPRPARPQRSPHRAVLQGLHAQNPSRLEPWRTL
ncbi:MAG: ATP-binding protein [Gammaproteobacteria bacterium]